MIGQKILHYEITEKLGEGGMGVVYKAEDTKLNRTVALKFINPAALKGDEEQERLVLEARAAAGLNHPNICTIYEINEVDGQTFIAMEFVDGLTLRDKVLSERIEVLDAVNYLIEIAEGLKETHQRGMVHRDIKSANIMIRPSGRAVIMDFGLARHADQIRPDERFSSGGTSAYMSPEQARGEGVDQRTDIWSLGVVLYEMLAGHLPFRGEYEQAVIYSILNETHEPLSSEREDVASGITEIVDVCLAKEPAERYQSLDDLIKRLRETRDELRGTGVARRGSDRRRSVGLTIAAIVTLTAVFVGYDFFRGKWAGSDANVPIAVIDFNNETDEAELNGLSGMLITALDQSQRLSVMTRSRMFDLLKVLGRDDVDRIDESLGQEICRAANVTALVIPTVQKFGDLYTIDLKVLDTRNNRYIFTTRKEGRGQESIPRMIDDIARDIRIDLKEKTDAVAATDAVASVTTVDLDAYQSYFRGEEQLNKLKFKDARESFKTAIELDSTFALAHYRLAYTEWWAREAVEDARVHAGYAVSNIDRIPDRERFLVRALVVGLEEGFEAQIPILEEMRERYPDDKEMLFALGDAEFHSFNYDSASVHFGKVLTLDPAFERALQHQAWTFIRTKSYENARTAAKQWADHTGSPEAYSTLAAACYYLDEMDAAESAVRSAIAAAPDEYFGYSQLVELQIARNQTEEAEAELRRLLVTGGEKVRGHAGRLLTSAFLPYQGRYKEADAMIDAGIESILASADSTWLAMSQLGKAINLYRAYDDSATCMRVAEATLLYPDKAKPMGYRQTVAAIFALTGDIDRARDMMTEQHGVMGKVMEPMLVSLHAATFGDCETALAVVDSVIEAAGGGASDMQLDNLWYAIGKCQLEAGQYTAALESFEKFDGDGRVTCDSAPMYPMLLLSRAKALEGVGKTSEALSVYRELLDIWKHADEDLPDYIEASRRLKQLQAASSM